MKFPNLPLKIRIIGGIGLAALMIASGLGLAHYTSTNPGYCLGCHATKETPDKSKKSLVHPSYSRVSCVDCHAKSGQSTVAEGYRGGFSAEPERVNANCVRCHENVAKNGEVQFEYNELNIRIPHQAHIELDILCVDCHSNIAHDMSESATSRPHMATCSQCHSLDDDSCETCHP